MVIQVQGRALGTHRIPPTMKSNAIFALAARYDATRSEPNILVSKKFSKIRRYVIDLIM